MIRYGMTALKTMASIMSLLIISMIALEVVYAAQNQGYSTEYMRSLEKKNSLLDSISENTSDLSIGIFTKSMISIAKTSVSTIMNGISTEKQASPSMQANITGIKLGSVGMPTGLVAPGLSTTQDAKNAIQIVTERKDTEAGASETNKKI